MRARSQDFAQYVPYHVTKSSHHLGWRGFRGEIVRGHSAGEITLPPLDHHLLNLIVSVPTLHEHRWGGVQREEVGREGAASLVPAGHQSYWRWRYVEEGVPCDFHLHLDPAFVRRIAVVNLDDLPQDVEFRANLCFYNPALRVLAQLCSRRWSTMAPMDRSMRNRSPPPLWRCSSSPSDHGPKAKRRRPGRMGGTASTSSASTSTRTWAPTSTSSSSARSSASVQIASARSFEQLLA